VDVPIVLILAVGFLVGMVPAMLLVGFFGGRQVERQRKDLKLQYERQVTAMRATIRRLMQRIDLLSVERKQLKSSNQNLQEALRDQHRYADNASAELLQLKQKVESLTAQNMRHEGRLEEARMQQERREAQFAQTVAQFTEVDRLRRHLLFATNQLRAAQESSQRSASSSEENLTTTQFLDLSDHSPADLDVGVIASIEPLYVERLHESGVHTVADLARQTPARLAHFAGLSSWDDPTQWIAEAKALLTPPPTA
jgi:predicted flap endonuclease-1-like 5' DNA nuclease